MQRRGFVLLLVAALLALTCVAAQAKSVIEGERVGLAYLPTVDKVGVQWDLRCPPLERLVPGLSKVTEYVKGGVVLAGSSVSDGKVYPQANLGVTLGSHDEFRIGGAYVGSLGVSWLLSADPWATMGGGIASALSLNMGAPPAALAGMDGRLGAYYGVAWTREW